MIFKRALWKSFREGIRKRSVRKGWDKGLRVKALGVKAKLKGHDDLGQVILMVQEVVGVSWGPAEIL